jgi:hypothetical protein
LPRETEELLSVFENEPAGRQTSERLLSLFVAPAVLCRDRDSESFPSEASLKSDLFVFSTCFRRQLVLPRFGNRDKKLSFLNQVYFQRHRFNLNMKEAEIVGCSLG